MSRDINGKLLRRLREARQWSQEELAIAAGIGLRTVQRLEAEESGSVRTLKSVAAALEIDMHNLEEKPRTALTGVRWGYAGVIVGVACAVAAVVIDLVIYDGEAMVAGLMFGAIGLVAGLALPLIGYLTDRADR